MECWICGKDADFIRPTAYDDKTRKGKARVETKDFSNYRSFCKECKKKHDEEVKSDREKHAILKKKVMFERALELMEAQGCKMATFRNAAIKTQRYLYSNIDKFDSADEMIAAIILIKNGISFQPQAKVGKYQVDLLIPSIKVALEIDGERHTARKAYDSRRDKEIKDELGEGWEVVRIGTEHIEKNAEKLPEAITALKEFKKITK